MIRKRTHLLKIKKELNEAELRLARKDLLTFTRYTMPSYRVNWHHEFLAQKLTDFAFGKIQYLMVFMPPRFGKSELVSRRLPAFLHGLNPDFEIMAVSYLDSLASDMCISVQEIIDSDSYKQVFPGTRIHPPRMSYTDGRRNSSEHTIIGAKGVYRGQGVGGSFTGRGANFCFPKGVEIATASVYKDISEISVGDLVWTFNHNGNHAEIKKVENISTRDVSRLVQVEMSSGCKILCTPEHPFFTEKRGYTNAEDLLPGDGAWCLSTGKNHFMHLALQFLFGKIREAKVRISKAITTRPCRFLLWTKVLRASPRSKKSQNLRKVREANDKENIKVVLGWVQAITSKAEKKAMQGLLNIVSAYKSFKFFLFNFLQGLQSLSKDEREGKPKLQKWNKFISACFLQNKKIHLVERFTMLFNLQDRHYSMRPSYRRRQKQQLSKKLNNSVQGMSHYPPQIKKDTVSSVSKISNEDVKVYDIQVEGNHNFFAEGILVHNCLIDDPIKGREIADSEAFRERLWNFYTNDLFSRLETDLETGRKGQVLITQTRWHEADLSGRLLDQMKQKPGSAQFDIVHFPAIRVDKDNPDDIREIGEALWPEKYDLKQLSEIKEGTTPRGWSAVYQQNPVPGDGTLFKESMFEMVDIPGHLEFDWTFTTADTAYKERQENDFTVFTTFGMIADELYVIDVYRKQIESASVEMDVEPFILKHMGYGYRGTYIEPKGHGIYLNQAWRRKGNMMIMDDDTISAFYKDRRFDKVERANNVVPHLAHRKLKINKAIPNKEELVAECLGFPKMRHDDFVDTIVDGLKMAYGKAVSILDVL